MSRYIDELFENLPRHTEALKEKMVVQYKEKTTKDYLKAKSVTVLFEDESELEATVIDVTTDGLVLRNMIDNVVIIPFSGFQMIVIN
jgi:2-methylcitrate dehydratase PrpD